MWRILAGAITYSGALLGALRAYFFGHGEYSGADAVRQYLYSRFPAASLPTVRAVTARVLQAAEVGRRYGIYSPTYVPPDGIIPETGRIEIAAGVVQPDPAGNYPRRTYHTHGVIEIREAGKDQNPWNRIPGTVRSFDILSQFDAERMLMDEVDEQLQDFFRSPTVKGREKEFEIRVVIMGTHYGF